MNWREAAEENATTTPAPVLYTPGVNWAVTPPKRQKCDGCGQMHDLWSNPLCPTFDDLLDEFLKGWT